MDTLLAYRDPYCASIFMPTHRAGADSEQDPIRLKNLLRKAGEQMIESGLRAPDAWARLEGASALLGERAFWQQRQGGLAVFVGADTHQEYHVPENFQELVMVADRFHFTPLLGLVGDQTSFFILAISQNTRRLFRATRHLIEPVSLDGAPANLADAQRFTQEFRHVQFHSQTGPQMPGQGRSASIHSAGVGVDERYEKKRLLEYSQMVDAALERHLRNRREPLVLAAAEPLLSIYREACHYPGLYARGIDGNPDRLEARELHVQALRVLEPLFAENRRKAEARYRQLAGTGKAVTDLGAIVLAAYDGLVDMLFAARDTHKWGRFDPAARRAEEHRTHQPGDQDLINLAAVEAFRHGGSVYPMNRDLMPGSAVAAATLRFVG
jgi:hypothetical protein